MCVFEIDLDHLEAYEGGASLVALLAYPDIKHDGARLANLQKSLCALALNHRFRTEPMWANAAQKMKPEHALRSSVQIKQDMRTLSRRLRDRMVSGNMAAVSLRKTLTGELPPRHPDMKRCSINELSNLLLPNSESGDGCNIESRVWRPSLPVLPLATAVFSMTKWPENEMPDQVGFWQLMLSRPAIERAVAFAQAFETLFLENSLFNLTSENLIQVRLA